VSGVALRGKSGSQARETLLMRPWLNRSGVWFGRDDIALYLLVLANVLVFG
jgi:hypothetical protein